MFPFRFVLAVATLVLLSACGKKTEAPPPMTPPPSPPPVVVVTVAIPAPQHSATTAVARLAGSSTTPVRSPAAGFLIRQVFAEGALVKKGEVLFVLNPKPFEKTLDATETGYLRIVSPADGATGRSSVGPGDAVAANAILTTVADIDPIAAEFSMPAAYLNTHGDDVARELARPAAERPEEFELDLGHGAIYARKGRLGDGSLGSGGLRALFPNPDHLLLPGQYARITWQRERENAGFVVPAGSVRGPSDSATVDVVHSDGTVEQRRVSVWTCSDTACTVTGLQMGEQVVVDNDGRLGNGAKVTPQLATQPPPKAP